MTLTPLITLITLLILTQSPLIAHERFPAYYWWDESGNTLVEIEGHIFDISPINHTFDCPCEWTAEAGEAYKDSIKVSLWQ